MPKNSWKIPVELKYRLIGIVVLSASIFSIVSFLGFHTGPIGAILVKFFTYMFGLGSAVVMVFLVLIGLYYTMKCRRLEYSLHFIGYISLFLSLLTLFHHFRTPANNEIMPLYIVDGGGLLGGFILFYLRKLFGVDGTLVILFCCVAFFFLLTSGAKITKYILGLMTAGFQSWRNARSVRRSQEELEDEPEDDDSDELFSVRLYDQDKDKQAANSLCKPSSASIALSAAIDASDASGPAATTTVANSILASLTGFRSNTPATGQPVPAMEEIAASLAVVEPPSVYHVLAEEPPDVNDNNGYVFPPLSLLPQNTNSSGNKFNKEIADNARTLEETLDNFGVSAKIINTTQGPAVTRYELEPAAGVKVSKIVNLADDLALKLAASGIRIEAPIPGKAAIGIEVPNKSVEPVFLREVLESQEFLAAQSRLSIGLGKDITGRAIVTNLAQMPHLLVAGSTGSGKSVCINTMIVSIIYKATPQEVKLVLIDPKVVELSNYNGIPHLLTPVVTDSKKAASALHWAVQEMERRYQLFATYGVRDIGRFNEVSPAEKLPFILIIIDELADLMMVAPVDVEDAICRLAQKARASGIHLVLATQRPSVDVITGTIKANVPSRISFAVSSQIDSRTILDSSGAEKLLGKGDMLFYPVGAAKPVRVQGAFIGDQDIEKVIKQITQQAEPEYTEGVTSVELSRSSPVEQDKEQMQDELLEDAVRIILETGQASVSMLQRKFRIGYTRAARLIDTMEEMQIVGANNGSKARDILMTSDQVYTRYFKKE